MPRVLRLACAVCFALICQDGARSQTESAMIPREAFFAAPDKEQVMLSPDGKWVFVSAEEAVRLIRDGEFTTACAQGGPSDAIVFGDLRDPDSRVARIRQDPRGYHILEEVNTRPAITYLARVLHGAEA